MRIRVLVNACAGGVRRARGLPERLAAILGEEGRVVVSRSLEEARAALAAFLEEGVEAVGVCGGDGTLMHALTELARPGRGEARPLLVPIPAGTVGTVARNLGARGGAASTLSRLVASLRSGARLEVRRWGTLRVEGRCGFIFGAAMPARFMARYYRVGSGGVLQAAGLGARVALGALLGTPDSRGLFEPVAAQVEVDGFLLPERDYVLIVAATVTDVGLGIQIAYRACELAERFHLIASALPARALARQFPRTFRGRPIVGAGHHDCVARRAVLSFARPQPYLLDGELFCAERLALEAGPSFAFAAP